MKSLNIFILFISLAFTCSISAQTVYTTKTGEKYHKSSCRYLKYSKRGIKLDKARALGYQACKVCKPTASNLKSNTLTSKKENRPTPSKKTTVTQCIGKTKSGNRCKRKTKNANGRCYQH